MTLLRPSTLLSVVLLASCGGGTTSTADTTTTTTTTTGGEAQTPPAAATGDPANLPAMPEGIAGPPTAWDSMAPEAKGHWMAEHVVPTMAPLFAGYDSTRFANTTCATCHGSNAREVHFAMPSPQLPVLPQPGSDAWNHMASTEPRAMAFMATRVEHAMAALVGEQPYDPATQQGFSCMNCHTVEGAAAAAAPPAP